MHPRTYHSDAFDYDAVFDARRDEQYLYELSQRKPRLLPVEKEWSPYPVAKEQSK